MPCEDEYNMSIIRTKKITRGPPWVPDCWKIAYVDEIRGANDSMMVLIVALRLIMK